MRHKLLFLLCFTLIFTSCSKPHDWRDTPSCSADVVFEPNEFDVYIKPDTDIIPFEYSRELPPPKGNIDKNRRWLSEDPTSEAKMGVHYSVEGLDPFCEFKVYFEPNEAKGRYEGLHLIPSAIDHNMKLVLRNPIGENATLTINLIVDKTE